MNLSTTQRRMLGSVLYFAAVTLIINAFALLVIKVWPFKLGELNWRVGAAGLFPEAMLATVLPQVLIYTAAFLNEDRRLLAVLRWASLVVGILLFGLLAFFALDSVQIRAALPQNVKANFMKVALQAALIGTFLAALHVWVGVTLGKVLKSQGTVRVAGGSKESSQDGMLMVGSSREPSRPALRSVDADGAKKELKKEGTSGLTLDM